MRETQTAIFALALQATSEIREATHWCGELLSCGPRARVPPPAERGQGAIASAFSRCSVPVYV